MRIGRGLAAAGLLTTMLFAQGCMMSDQGFHAEKANAAAGVDHSDTLPRKVIVGTCMTRFTGSLEERLKLAVEVLDEMAKEAAKHHNGRGLDLAVLTEHAIRNSSDKSGAADAVSLDGVVADTFSAVARRLHTYIVLPLLLKEADGSGRCSNAAVLFDRDGKVAGIYRKVHLVVNMAIADTAQSLEGGLTPGSETPVFDCDFGKLGIQICWDNCYPDGWETLARKGAEIVAWPTASPATISTASYAMNHSYYIVSATPRDNAAIFNPTGMMSGQILADDFSDRRVLVREIDLSYAILDWTAPLEDGAALTRKYGARVGYQYSSREDEGLFWSNDPKMTIGEMARSLGLPLFSNHVEFSRKVADQVRGTRD